MKRTSAGKQNKPTVLQLYTMEETAAQLSVSRRWLQDFVRAHPHYRLAGRRKLFAAADIHSLHEAMARPPGLLQLVPRTPQHREYTKETAKARLEEIRRERKNARRPR